MISNTQDLRTEFQTIAQTLGLHFVFGASERVIMQQLGNIEYPCLWLGKPTVSLVRQGGLHRKYMCEFWILENADADDYAGQDEKMDSTLDLTQSVLQHLQARADAGHFIFDMEGATSDPKEKFTADDCLGWLTDVNLLGAACETADCCDD